MGDQAATVSSVFGTHPRWAVEEKNGEMVAGTGVQGEGEGLGAWRTSWRTDGDYLPSASAPTIGFFALLEGTSIGEHRWGSDDRGVGWYGEARWRYKCCS